MTLMFTTTIFKWMYHHMIITVYLNTFRTMLSFFSTLGGFPHHAAHIHANCMNLRSMLADSQWQYGLACCSSPPQLSDFVLPRHLSCQQSYVSVAAAKAMAWHWPPPVCGLWPLQKVSIYDVELKHNCFGVVHGPGPKNAEQTLLRAACKQDNFPQSEICKVRLCDRSRLLGIGSDWC